MLSENWGTCLISSGMTTTSLGGLLSLCSCPETGHTGKCSPPAVTGIISPLSPKTRAVTLLFIKCHSKTTSLEGQYFMLRHTHTQKKINKMNIPNNSKAVINTILQTLSTFYYKFISFCYHPQSLLEHQKGK